MIWSKDRLTRFEVARLVGARSLQISLGAPILVKAEDSKPSAISKIEFKEKVLPITIKRKLPSGEEVVVEIKKVTENWLVEHKGEV